MRLRDKLRPLVIAACAGDGAAALKVSNFLRFQLRMNYRETFSVFRGFKPELTEPEFDEVMQLADEESSK